MKQPLIFIHGSGDSADIWRAQVDYFERQGRYPAYAIDLPGQGQRPLTLPEMPTVEDYAQAVREIVTHELQLERPIIAGQSLGGAIALMMALQYPQETGGLILIATGARLRVLPGILAGAQQQPEQTRVQLTEMGVAEVNRATIPQLIIQEQVPGHHALYRNLAACNAFDVIPRLHEIHMPALILCGEEDRLTPLKYSQYLHEHIAGSSLYVVPGAGHYVMREQAEQVNQIIETWLDTLS